MLRRDLLKALAAFVTAGPAVAAAATPSGVRREPPFSGSGKPAVSAKSPPVAFTHAVATMLPTSARIYNGGAACEVTFRRIEA